MARKYPAFFPPVYNCTANIPTNADIGGTGVMAAFLVTAGLTTLVAAVPAFYELYQWIRKDRKQVMNAIANPMSTDGEPTHSDELSGTTKKHELVNKCESLLGPLCDLQAITGFSIATAALVTHNTISFYHEQLALGYWNITLNSFWASRAGFMEEDTDATNNSRGNLVEEDNIEKDKNKDLRVVFRRLSILASCIMGVTFQIWVIMREWKEGAWVNQSGHCYNYRDGSSNWPWVVGLLLFCPALFLRLFPTTRSWIRKWLHWMKDIKKWFLKKILQACKSLEAEWVGTRTNMSCPRAFLVVWRCFILLFSMFAFAMFWLSQVWLSVWAYGDTEYRITWWFYLGFYIWNSVDIITLRELNRHLLEDGELQWGFGQVLPLVMLLAIFYNLLDTFMETEKGKDDSKNSKKYVSRCVRTDPVDEI